MVKRLKNWLGNNWLIVFITFVGLCLRLQGLDFGRPFRYHPDEVKLVWQAMNLLNYQSWSRDTIFAIGTYPPFFTYILAGLYAGYNLLSLIFGAIPSLASVKESYYLDPFPYHMIGRAISVVTGTASVPLVYIIGKKLYTKETGLLAAAFLSVVSLHVRNSHFGTVDISQTFLMLVAFAFSVAIWQSGQIKYYLGAGIFIGLTVAMKYNGGVIILPLLLAHLFRSIKNNKIEWNVLLSPAPIIAIIGTIIAFLVACPMPLVDFKEFWGGLVGTARFEQTGKLGSGGSFWSYFTGQHSPGFGFFYDNNFYASLGYGIFFLFCLGSIFLLLRHGKRDFLILVIPVIMYMTAGHMKYKAMRHLLPMIPFLMIVASEFSFFLVRRFRAKTAQMVALGFIGICAIAPPAWKSFQYGRALNQTDTRTLLKDWIEAQIPENTRIGMEEFGPQLLSLKDLNLAMIRKSPNYRRIYDIFGLIPGMFTHGNQTTKELNPVNYIQEHRIQYVVLSSFSRARYSWKLSQARYPEVVKARQEFYHWVSANGTLIYKALPQNRFNIFPELEIYQLNNVSGPTTELEQQEFKQLE